MLRVQLYLANAQSSNRYVTNTRLYHFAKRESTPIDFSRLLQCSSVSHNGLIETYTTCRYSASTLTDPAYFFATIYRRRDIARVTTRKFLPVKICYLSFDTGPGLKRGPVEISCFLNERKPPNLQVRGPACGSNFPLIRISFE